MKIRISDDNDTKEVDIYTEEGFKMLSDLWLKASCHQKIMYEPTWLGIPIIQLPEDIITMQELIWKIRPDVIIETGVAHGGSAILYASILELIGKGVVIGIDVEIRKYNELLINSHPLSKRIRLIEGSSIETETVDAAKKMLKKGDKVLVSLDSNHSYQHVLKEMEIYSQMVSDDSYMVVMDGAQGLVWDIPRGKKEWKEDNPLLAIEQFLKDHSSWQEDQYYTRFGITSSPRGFLKRTDDS